MFSAAPIRLRAREIAQATFRAAVWAREAEGRAVERRNDSSAPPPARFSQRTKRVNKRSTSRIVTFRRPFVLEDFPALAPAGDYVIDTEEEEIDTILSSSWRRISTTIRIRVDGAIEFRLVDPQALQDALARDGAQDVAALPPLQSTAKGRTERARKFLTAAVHPFK